MIDNRKWDDSVICCNCRKKQRLEEQEGFLIVSNYRILGDWLCVDCSYCDVCDGDIMANECVCDPKTTLYA